MSRKKTSGGQALVLITLALLAMSGLMGLAVDLGWSYFVQKQAQAAADGAALAAVQEAVTRLRAGGSASVTGFTCVGGGTGATQVDCKTTAISCGSVTSTSNLNNGCQYALKNGFNWTSAANQNVTLQSNDGQTADLPATAPGVKNIAYWVTVRTVQTLPQLFSAVLGNSHAVVSAVATAAIAGVIKPGSFYGMNRAGDCLTGADAGNCGLDVITGHGKGKGKSGSQACGPGGIISDLCAPSGIILASSCNSTVGGVCDQADAGIENGAAAVGASLTIMGPSGAVSGTWEDLSGTTMTPTHSTNAATFQDPTAPNSQPPLETSGSSMGTCGLPHTSPSVAPTITGPLGPYVYYTYSSKLGGKPVPDGGQINIGSSGATFSSSVSTACPTVSSKLADGSTGSVVSTTGTTDASFPTYIFVGGLNNSGTMTLGPGQYVMAGTNSTTGSVFTNSGTVDGTSAAAQATGTMFIFTDAAYPGMNLTSNTAANFLPVVSGGSALNQGTIDVSNNVSLSMYGLVPSVVSGSTLPSSMNAYSGIVWWQDRRNSNVGYDESAGSPGCPSGGCTGDNGSVISCAVGCPYGSSATPNVLAASNHVTDNSPGVLMSNGNTKIELHGVYYQPRGAYIDFGDGNTGINCGSGTPDCPLQVVTGAVLMGNGNTRMVLAGPTDPLLTYKATLIQ